MAMEQDSAYDSPRSADLSLSPLSPHSLVSKYTSLCSIACSSCKKTFVDPRVLPCLHTFCFPCLEALCKPKKTIICPQCHVDFCLPSNGIDGLIPDYGIVSFIKSLKGHLFCSSCKIADVVTAVAKCINCDNFLCQSCVNAHNYMYCFEGHKVIEFPKDFLADTDKASVPTDDGQLNCLIHPTFQITHFCVQCNEPVCTSCVLDGHTGHRVEALDVIGDTLISIMNMSMDDNKSCMSELNISLRSAKRMDNFLRNQYLDISQKITENYNLFNAMLLKHKQQQMSVLEQLYFKSKAAVQNHVNVYQDTLEKTTKVADFYSRLIKYGSTAQILMFKKMLEDKRFPLFKPKPISANLKFVSKPCDFASLIYNAFGHVASEVNAAPELDLSQSLLSSTYYKYDKWSSHGLSAHGLDDLKFSELGICDDLLSPIPRSYSLKSSVTRQVITYTHKFGRYGSSQGEFTEPNGVAINAGGDIIIADTNNNRVQIFDKNGVYKYHFGEGSKAKDSGNLLFPNRVAVMEKTGDIVVTERAPTHQVQIYNQYGQFIRRFGANILQHPRAVAVDSQGRIIVVECKVMRVIIFDQSGDVLNKFHCNQTLHFPNGVAVNDRQQIFISDNRIHCVVVYDYNGQLIRTIGQEGVTNYPIGVMLNRKGQVSNFSFEM